jgi:hypothetical protein
MTDDSSNGHLREDACSAAGSEEVYSDVENALPGCLVELTSSLRRSDSTRKGLEVEFDISIIGMINAPQYSSDPYRQISISKIMPEIKPINDTWREVPYPYVSKYNRTNYWSKSWTTRHEACAHFKKKQAWNCALARRSSIILSLEPGVDTMEVPDKGPTVAQGEHKYTVGMCEFPSHIYIRHQCVHQPFSTRKLSSMLL